jgi:isoleucyl-tRNA synthetase
VIIKSPDKRLEKLLRESLDVLPFIFIVSQAQVSSAELTGAVKGEAAPIEVQVDRALGAKCQRCWNYSEYVGRDSAHPSLCARCVNIVNPALPE